MPCRSGRAGTIPEASNPLISDAKKEPVSLPGPKKGRYSKPIAPELELASALIPQRDGKLPSQSLPHPLAMIFPHVGNEFGVAMGNELVSTIFQICPALDVIKQFTVKDHENTPILVGNRLLTIG